MGSSWIRRDMKRERTHRCKNDIRDVLLSMNSSESEGRSKEDTEVSGTVHPSSSGPLTRVERFRRGE